MGTIIIVCPVRRRKDISIAVKLVICFTFHSSKADWPCGHLRSTWNCEFHNFFREIVKFLNSEKKSEFSYFWTVPMTPSAACIKADKIANPEPINWSVVSMMSHTFLFSTFIWLLVWLIDNSRRPLFAVYY